MLPLGIYSWFCYPLPLEKRLELIKQAGFDTTCLWLGYEEEMVRDGHADLLPDLVREKGLTLDNVHAPFEHSNLLWSESQDSRAMIREELTAILAFCAKHRIPIMTMHLSAGDAPPPPSQNGLQLMSDLVLHAEDSSVTIALENLKGTGPDYLDFVYSNLQSPNLGFCYDSSHDFIASRLRGRALEKWGDLLITTHLSDNHGTNDDHLLPGRGTIDWHAVARYFPRRSYKGALMLEVDGPDATEGLTPEEFLWAGYEWLQLFEKTVGG